jgi:UDP:flavonoid glycosyltransferase YjiC (YdhE family)
MSRHVLFVGASQKSHLIHMQGLAEEMAARGYKVTFAALESDRAVVTSASNSGSVEFLSAGEPEHDAAHYGYTHDILDLFRLCADYSVHLYDSLFPKLKAGDGIDLVVFDHLFWPAGHALARDLEARGVMLYPGLFGLEHLGMEPDYVPMIISGFSSPVMTNLPQRIQNFIMLRVARNILQTVRSFIFRSALKRLKINDGNPYGKTKLALHGSFGGLGEVSRNQKTLGGAPMIQSTGPWLPRSTFVSSEIEALLNDVDATPIVFVAIGTNAYWTSEMVDVFVGALLEFNETNELRVLWSIKDSSGILEPALKRASTSLEDISNVLTVVPFVDQLAVLQSKSVAAFVSHCGFGSVQEALFTGIPVLATPMMLGSDQVTNAARLVQLGAAESFDSRKDVITTAALLTKLRALTTKGDDENNHYKLKALELSRISHRLQGPTRAADWLEMEMMEPTGSQFMIGVEEQLSWVELNSLDVYAVLLLLAAIGSFVGSKVLGRCRRRKSKKD